MKKKSVRTPDKTAGSGDLRKIIGRSLESLDLGQNLGNFAHPVKNRLFLKRFSAGDMARFMEHIGLIGHLKRAGFRELSIDIETDDSSINYLKIYEKDSGHRNILVDVRVSESKFIPDKKYFEKEEDHAIYDMVVIEWLSAQNPSAVKYDRKRPQLPGQNTPGLGVLKYMFRLLYVISRGIFNDGFMDIPEHIHGSIMYSKKFKFFDPVNEAALRAVLRDLKGRSLSDISWGIITETIIEKKTGLPLKYSPAHQVYPISERLNHYFGSRKYRNDFNRIFREKSYAFDFNTMAAKREELLAWKEMKDI